MTKFYTRQGDRGISQMGRRKLPKDNPVIEALGNLDELNSWLGVCRTESKGQIYKIIRQLQEDLFIVQAEIAALALQKVPKIKITIQKILAVEKIIDRIDQVLPTITRFVISGGSLLSARLDYARTLARRVERQTKRLARSEKNITPELLQYLNRLSSILFALARFVNFKLKIKEEHPSYK